MQCKFHTSLIEKFKTWFLYLCKTKNCTATPSKKQSKASFEVSVWKLRSRPRKLPDSNAPATQLGTGILVAKFPKKYVIRTRWFLPWTRTKNFLSGSVWWPTLHMKFYTGWDGIVYHHDLNRAGLMNYLLLGQWEGWHTCQWHLKGANVRTFHKRIYSNACHTMLGATKRSISLTDMIRNFNEII